MATTQNFPVGAGAWVRIASARPDGQVVKVQGAAQFVLAVTVGHKDEAPEFAPLSGHRFTTIADLPIVGKQHLWASSATSQTLTVT